MRPYSRFTFATKKTMTRLIVTITAVLTTLSFLVSCQSAGKNITATTVESDTLRYPQEKHLKNVRQLTFGGNNAEAYFSFDNKKIVFQSDYAQWGVSCDQIFVADLAKSDMRNKPPRMISTSQGRTTCSYFMPGNKTFVYASTHLGHTKKETRVRPSQPARTFRRAAKSMCGPFTIPTTFLCPTSTAKSYAN